VCEGSSMITRRQLHARIKSLQTEVDILWEGFNKLGIRVAKLTKRTELLEDLDEINDRFLSAWPENTNKRIGLLEARLDEANGTTLPEVVEDNPITPTPLPALIASAIDAQQPVLFRYTKEGETEWESRTLSPYELITVQKGTVTRGWDHDREDIRSFRLDRMEALTWACTAYRKPQTAS
jgi:predicted DNA-binding transcriptional regulator YafY